MNNESGNVVIVVAVLCFIYLGIYFFSRDSTNDFKSLSDYNIKPPSYEKLVSWVTASCARGDYQNNVQEIKNTRINELLQERFKYLMKLDSLDMINNNSYFRINHFEAEQRIRDKIDCSY